MVLASQRQLLGARGEVVAEEWYRSRGYEVVARNWRSNLGELDLVVRLGRQLVFCEVKTRSSSVFGTPFEAVSWSKQARLRRLAASWLEQRASVDRAQREFRPTYAIRFDVAGVICDKRGAVSEVEVTEEAF